MTKREHFLKILAGESESCGFWHGRPRADALPRLCEYFGVPDDFSLGLLLGDDVCWIWPEAENFWPDGELFDFLNGNQPRRKRRLCGHGRPGSGGRLPVAGCVPL